MKKGQNEFAISSDQKVRIKVIKEKCISAGTCIVYAADTFDLDEDGRLNTYEGALYKTHLKFGYPLVEKRTKFPMISIRIRCWNPMKCSNTNASGGRDNLVDTHLIYSVVSHTQKFLLEAIRIYDAANWRISKTFRESIW